MGNGLPRTPKFENSKCRIEIDSKKVKKIEENGEEIRN